MKSCHRLYSKSNQSYLSINAARHNLLFSDLCMSQILFWVSFEKSSFALARRKIRKRINKTMAHQVIYFYVCKALPSNHFLKENLKKSARKLCWMQVQHTAPFSYRQHPRMSSFTIPINKVLRRFEVDGLQDPAVKASINVELSVLFEQRRCHGKDWDSTVTAHTIRKYYCWMSLLSNDQIIFVDFKLSTIGIYRRFNWIELGNIHVPIYHKTHLNVHQNRVKQVGSISSVGVIFSIDG